MFVDLNIANGDITEVDIDSDLYKKLVGDGGKIPPRDPSEDNPRWWPFPNSPLTNTFKGPLIGVFVFVATGVLVGHCVDAVPLKVSFQPPASPQLTAQPFIRPSSPKVQPD